MQKTDSRTRSLPIKIRLTSDNKKKARRSLQEWSTSLKKYDDYLLIGQLG